MLPALDERFIPDNSSTIKVFNRIKLYLQNITVDPNTTTQFIQQKLYLVKNIDILNLNRFNWQKVVTTI